MSEPSIFIATPLGGPMVHYAYTAGALQAMSKFAGRIAIDTQMGSFLPRNRDMLAMRFLDSGASHLMSVDSDIGWSPDQVQKLLDTGLECVSGLYGKKQPTSTVPAKLIDPECQDVIAEAEYAPGGFILCARSVIERMVGAYRHMQYRTERGDAYALWSYQFTQGVTYDQEDVAWCRRWRAIGGKIYLHRGVVVRHYGDYAYVPDAQAIMNIRG